MITINAFGIACLWLMMGVMLLIGWVIGHDKGYAKARREFNK